MVVGGGSMGSRNWGRLSASCSVDGSGTMSSVSTGPLIMEVEFCRRIGTGDAGRCEDVDGFGCSSPSLSTTSTALSLPFLLLGVPEARAGRLSSVAPNDKAREIRLQPLLDEVASEHGVASGAGSEDPFGFPTRPTMLLRIVDLLERFGRSDDATAPSSRDGVEESGN